MALLWPRRSAPWVSERARQSDGQPMPNHKPISLRWPFLVFFALYIATLIGLVEYGNRILPTSYDWDVDSVAPTPGAPAGRPTGFVTGALVRPRQTSAASPGTGAVQGSKSRVARSTIRHTRHAGHRFTRRNETAFANGTALTPLMVGGLNGLSPETFDYLNLTHPAPTYNLSTSLNLNQSYAEERRRRKRIPESSNFGSLGGPVVRLVYRLHYYALEVGHEWNMRLSFIQLNPEDPGTYAEKFKGCNFDSPVQISDKTWCVDGMVTCNGPEVIFHEDKTWQKWQQAYDVENGLLSAGTPLWFEGYSTWYINDDLPGCALPIIANVYDRYQFHQYFDVADKEDHPSETTIVVNDESGNPATTLTGQVLRGVDAAGSLVPTATRLKAGASLPTPSQATFVDAAGITHTASLAVLKDSRGVPTATAGIFTLRDANGNPTLTTTRPITATVVTLRDAAGRPTATITLQVPRPYREVHTLTDANGNPTATVTVTNRPATDATQTPFPQIPLPTLLPPSAAPQLHVVTPSEYGLVLFLPTLLAILAGILAQTVYSDLRALLPFNALTRPGGASAGQSLAMKTEGLSGLLNSIYLLVRMKEPLSIFTDVLVFLLAVVTTLSPEAVGIKLYGKCEADNSLGCYMGVAVFIPPSRAVQALLAVCLVLVVAIAFFLRKWQTGVAGSPRAIGATAALVQDREVRALVRGLRAGKGGEVTGEEVMERLGGRKFVLRRFRMGTGTAAATVEYGITTASTGRTYYEKGATFKTQLTKASTFLKTMRIPSWGTVFPTSGLKRSTRYRAQDGAAVLFLWGLMILVIYYNLTGKQKLWYETGFERWMNDQNFGVRVLFTGLGVVITFLWDDYYERITILEPYRQLSLKPQPPTTTLLVSPPTSVFTGFFGAVKRREAFVTAVAFTTILAKFVPTLLSTVPFSPIQTWHLHLVCTWMTVASLAFMSAVLAYGLLFVRYPPLPIDPRTLAGRIYYLCDSPAATTVEDFRGLSLLPLKSGWKDKVEVDGRRKRYYYRFGKTMGAASGEVRVGIERVNANVNDRDRSWGYRQP